MIEKIKSSVIVVVASIAIIVLCLIFWQAYTVFLLAFASILLALILSLIANVFCRGTKIPYSLSLLTVVFGLFILLGLVFWASAPFISEQINELSVALPKAYEESKASLSKYVDLKYLSGEKFTGEFLLNHQQILGQAALLFSLTVGTITSFLIFGLVGIYLAFSPDRYLDGFCMAFPPKRRRDMKAILLRIGHALRWWLMGKFVSMTIIGILTGLGLYFLKVPLALALGILAGLLTFIPYIGVIISLIPAVLLAFTISPWLVLYVVILYLAVHSLDSYFISPFVDQRTVAIPPALTIMAQLLFTVLMGFIGLALASPLLVVLVMAISEFYRKRELAAEKSS